MSRKRSSSDTKTNNYGKQLINICQNIDVYIANGRLGERSALATCRDASVVDYILLSSELFSDALNLNVLNFDPLFSDVHNTITLKLHSSAFLIADVSEECDLSEVTCDDTSFRYKWDRNKVDAFSDFIDKDTIVSLNDRLNDMLNLHIPIDEHSVNDINNNLCNMLHIAADKWGNILEKGPYGLDNQNVSFGLILKFSSYGIQK